MYSSQLPFSFPCYVESDDFDRLGLGRKVYFLTRDSYEGALQDSDIIPDSAYFGSPEHSIFLQSCLPSSPILADGISSLRHNPSSYRHALLHSLNLSHPNFFDNLLRFAGQILDDFGISHYPDFQQKFPTEHYFRTIRMEWESFSRSDVCDGHAVEMQLMLTFDRFQREHLNNVFFLAPFTTCFSV